MENSAGWRRTARRQRRELARRLDIGCGDRPYEPNNPEWEHLDERELDHVEHVMKAENVSLFKEEFDEILARHVLEHFSWRYTYSVLAGWYGALKPGGLIRIEVPNLMWQARALVNGSNPHYEVVNLIFGDQDYEGNYHKTGFTEELLGAFLKKIGFVHVETRDIGMVILAQGRRPE
jgi:predicted SAM-dependent methyltransferase